RRSDLTYYIAQSDEAIGETLFWKGDLRGAKAALRRAHEFSRDREYFDLLFLTRYYQWRIAAAEGDAATLNSAFSSMRFFATRIQDSFDELEEFKRILANQEEGRP